MNKTKIDWADRTWNPVTGCLHDCEYCYARKIAKRFGGTVDTCPTDAVHELEEPLRADNYRKDDRLINPYPWMFDPTFHRYRLGEPARIKKPQTIFVCSMADLFGKWVPDEWIKEVFKACEAAPQHRYLFLTKNPKRYPDIKYHGDIWLGETITRQGDFIRQHGRPAGAKQFVSIEPILESITIPRNNIKYYSWVIVGAETGNRKDKTIPSREWITRIVLDCRTRGIPVFMKESLRELMGDDFIQEYPWKGATA